MSAVDIATQRLMSEEGKRPRAYNDATGKTVSCRPEGNLSIGYGINLENGLDDEEMAWLLSHRLGKAEKALSAYSWYAVCNDVRRSVLLDIAYNAGLSGLLHYPHMLAAVQVGDWLTASRECGTSDAALKPRYELLGHLLMTGSGT